MSEKGKKRQHTEILKSKKLRIRKHRVPRGFSPIGVGFNPTIEGYSIPTPYSVLQAVPSRPCEASGQNLIRDKSRKPTQVAKVESWSPMDLPVKWDFLEYKFDMK